MAAVIVNSCWLSPSALRGWKASMRFLGHLTRGITAEMLDQELMEDRSKLRADDAPSTKVEVEGMLATIRKNGISRCRDALLPNFTSFSAPIFDQAGFMIAAITMMGPIGILDDDLEGPTATALRTQARALSATAGWVAS